MGRGDTVETRSHVTGFREEISKAAERGADAFFTWFDNAADTNAAFVRGQEDFRVHIAEPAFQYLSAPSKLKALEIGYGGGRLLAAACRCFQTAVGVDIHPHRAMVAKELNKRGVTNFTLLETTGNQIPVDDASIDFVYSFIVLQHVEKVATFTAYVREASRTIRPGGVAVLYFGRRAVFSQGRSSRLLYLADRILEGLVLRGRYHEMPAVVNDINLIVSLAYASRVATQNGFQVLRRLVSRKNAPGGGRTYGAQHGLILRKTAIG